MEWRTAAVYAAIAVGVAALLWPGSMAGRAVRSVGEALHGTLTGQGV